MYNSLKEMQNKLDKYSKVNLVSGCIEWTGYKTFGYGKIRVGKNKIRAHRAAYLVYKGKIPKGMLVCHKCDNPSCVNPDHLFLGTALDNAKDRDSKGRNGTIKLTDIDVKNIRLDPRKTSILAKEYGVSPVHICRIRRKARRSLVMD